MRMRFLLTAVLCILAAGAAARAEDSIPPADMSEEEALQLGESMYRDGILPSGEPMQAIVMGDIPVDGRMFTCDDCHQRSGLGSVEGTVITWPTNGRELYKPRRSTGAWHPPETEAQRQDVRKKELPEYWKQIEPVRPAYTDESLARALRTGIDPAGRKLDPIMPLYLLDDRDMGILVHYLKNLSVDLAPGVDETTIRFATVVADDVPAEDRRTMLATLQAHIDVHNSQSRHQERRAASGPFFKTQMHQAYRRMQLDIWELTGPAETWPAQLQEYYEKQPVFALLGGMASGSWRPVHEFCEQHKIPAIFPLTDFPVVSESDWYTLYYSKGFYQEGETAARYLHRIENIEPDAGIVIVSRDDLQGKALRQGFAETWKTSGRQEPEHLLMGPEEKATEEFWRNLMQTKQPKVLILWLGTGDLGKIENLALGNRLPDMVILSSELLEYTFGGIPDELRDSVYLTYPYSLPGTEERGELAVKNWLQARNIPLADLTMQAKIYFFGWMLPGAVKYMRSEFFREYFLEGFDMMIDQDYAIPVYPRLTFGNGQRYASKGCYIVQLTKGSDPELVQKSDWVIH
ncbi:MAG: hypothetical protein SCH71_13700 [Desulfobulbaceae bacterium]|nr:hypothetical protein [Desulfobulbaceae bacterium]